MHNLGEVYTHAYVYTYTDICPNFKRIWILPRGSFRDVTLSLPPKVAPFSTILECLKWYIIWFIAFLLYSWGQGVSCLTIIELPAPGTTPTAHWVPFKRWVDDGRTDRWWPGHTYTQIMFTSGKRHKAIVLVLAEW